MFHLPHCGLADGIWDSCRRSKVSCGILTTPKDYCSRSGWHANEVLHGMVSELIRKKEKRVAMMDAEGQPTGPKEVGPVMGHWHIIVTMGCFPPPQPAQGFTAHNVCAIELPGTTFTEAVPSC